MKIVNVELGERSYPIYIKTGLLNNLSDIFLKHQVPKKKLAIITDSNVHALYAKGIAEKLKSREYDVHIFEIPAGEESKSLKMVDFLCEKLIMARFDRKSPLIALGGGVVGDLAGFVAATFLRGVPFIQIPTTLLSQTDSSVGGKVAVNHSLGKNLIGSFYQPRFVIIDPIVLRTLDKREIWAGMGEVIKYGLIWNNHLFQLLEENMNRITEKLDFPFIATILERCCSIKSQVVTIDEREGGLRKILNFGHTIAHALEAMTNYTHFRHGEAVLWGMLAMSWLSKEENLLNNTEYNKIEQLILSVPNSNHDALHLSSESILSKIYLDKKNVDSQICVVLLDEIGKAVIKNEFDEQKLQKAIDFLLKTMKIPN